MRVLDCLRLGFAGVKAHKKRAIVVVIIVGLLFGVIMAGGFILQGLENAIFAEMLAPTGGKVLVMSSVDATVCGENCDMEAETAAIKQNIERYGGELVVAGAAQVAGEIFYKLDSNVFVNVDNVSVDMDVVQVVVPLATAVKLANIELPVHDTEAAIRVRAIKEAREQTLRKVVESEAGKKYYIAGILPGWMYSNDLSLTNLARPNVKIKDNPLNLILGQISTGTRQNFVENDVETEEADLIFAQFENVKAAHAYYRDKANYCAEFDHIFADCGEDYRYQVRSAVADPLATYEAFQNVWLIYKVVAGVLVVIAIIIALSTYARLISKDTKIIALYHAMGATGWQIRLAYITYLSMLSLMAVIFAVVVGLMLAALLSIANMEALEQIFAVGLGVVKEGIWLIGWNNLHWYMIGTLMLTAIVAVVLGNGNFRVKELARKLK